MALDLDSQIRFLKSEQKRLTLQRTSIRLPHDDPRCIAIPKELEGVGDQLTALGVNVLESYMEFQEEHQVVAVEAAHVNYEIRWRPILKEARGVDPGPWVPPEERVLTKEEFEEMRLRFEGLPEGTEVS